MSRNSGRGFTLIELIVSIGLFTIVVTVVMTAFLRIISLDRVARATNDVTTNLSFAVDAMSRGIRTGTLYNCDDTNRDCPDSGAEKFSYTDALGNTVTYILVTNGGRSYIGTCAGSISSDSCNASNATAITDPRIDITSLKFYTRGIDTQSGADSLQPQVLFTIQGSITPDSNSAPVTFSIQSGATQRRLDI